MKKLFLLLVLVVMFGYCAGMVSAQEVCYSSGLKAATEQITTPTDKLLLCGVELVPAAADSTLIVYNGTTATSGKELVSMAALASTTPSGIMPAIALSSTGGIYAVLTGAGAKYIIWYR
jgi:hypothetical protein